MFYKTYNTIEHKSTYEYEIKRSRFIGHAIPVSSVEEAQSFIQSIKTMHRDARHNVYAYIVVDGENKYTKYSDDAEPQGTAGLPLLNCIEKKGLVNTVVVVTRYFGGILLGAPGLLRAYTNTAVATLEQAGVKTRVLCKKVIIKADYRYISPLMNLFSSNNLYPTSSEYAEQAVFTLIVEIDDIDMLSYNVRELTSDNAEVEIGEYEYK